MSERPFRVVLVEDNEDDADLVARAVRRFGSSVELVRMGTIPSAIEHLKEGVKTDLVLIDGKIEGVDAEVFFEMAEAENLMSAPCVVLKGCSNLKTDNGLLQMGAREVRSKPVDYTLFLEQVTEILVAFGATLGTPAVSAASDEKK